jgi:hypothetical protein
MEHLNDQENRPVGGLAAAVGAGRRAGKHVVEPQQQSRAVLGEISQNTGIMSRRQQPTRGSKPQGSSFSIFCDESSTVANQTTSLQYNRTGFASAVVGGKSTFSTTTTGFTTINKENLLPKDVKGEKSTGLHARVLRQNTVQHQRTVLASLPPCTEADLEPMNTSLTLGVDSPMVMETSLLGSSGGLRSTGEKAEQWRVPPIQDNQTVDIFTEPEYAQDIYRYLRDSELKNLPKSNYMAKQGDITHAMRSILVDWLVEVGEEYKLQTETLHLAINYIDRFLSYMAVQRSKLQLVGAACMFIAAKYEEIYPPDVGEFVYITDDTYNKRQVLRMEHLVLKVLNFDLSVPTTHLFISKIIESVPHGAPNKAKLESLANYLSELALVEGQAFLKFSPSLLAASSVAMARHTLDLPAWPEHLATRAGYTLEELKDCFVGLHNVFTKAETNAQQAVRDKYKDSKKYHAVSELSPPNIY